MKNFINKIINNIFRKNVKFRGYARYNHKQETNIYWDPQMAQILETWGKDHVWNEIQMLLINCEGKILDIACGTGVTIEILSRYKSLEIYGVDISDFLISKAIKRGLDTKKLIVCDVIDMGIYGDNFFDYSYSIGSLEHFAEEGIQKAIAEIYRITKKISFHMVPVSRSEKNKGWITPYQSYYNNSTQWWIEKFKSKYPDIYIINSVWNDNQSVGRWFICIK